MSFILMFSLVSACVETQEKEPVTDKSKLFHVYDISYRIPSMGDWAFEHQDEYSVLLKNGEDEDPVNSIAKIEVIDNERYYTDKQLFFLLEKTFLLEEKTTYKYRYEIIDSSVTKTSGDGIFCIRTYSKLKDFRPKAKPAGSGFMIMETLEHICRHPKDPSKFVIVGFSMRAIPRKADTDFILRAEDFIRNIEY